MGFRLRSLMNVRVPMAADETFLAVQDDYLRRELDARGVVRLSDLRPLCGDLYLWQGDITRLQCGAIVNAANAGMTGCYIPCHACIDNCIHTYAGVQLRRDCAEIMAAQGSAEPTGRAKITRAYNLPCDYVLHTVGPIVNGRVTSEDERLLAACYRSCLELAGADAVVIGAGAGLSTSAGFVYTGERFEKYFSDFAAKYSFHDMYSGGFYPYATLEEHWAYWSRYIYINRYLNAPKPVYEKLLSLVKDKDSFVLTTNVDHCFQKAGFDKHRLFYTQGDYGLFQCSEPCCAETFDNGELIQNMVTAQGYTIAPDGTLTVPEAPKMAVPTELVPHCPHCGRPLTTNLRCDGRFVQDEGWYAAERYENFLRTRAGQRILFLELGVGYNTPGIIKYPFWRMTDGNPRAVYACLNAGDACAPDAIKDRSVCIDGDLADILAQI